MENFGRTTNEVDKINMHTISVQNFEGPLDVLLQMIEGKELDISEVSLSDICDQYVQYVEIHTDDISPSELADFLMIASRLLMLKVRKLLPMLQPEEEEDETSLEDQLKMYKLFHDAANTLAKNDYGFAQSLPRKMQQKEYTTTFQPDKQINLQSLQKTYQQVIKGVPFIRLPEKTIRKTLNIQSRITELRLLLEGMSEVSFKGITKEAEDNADVIVSFIALLELVKLQEIELEQPTMFEDITISLG